MKKNYAIILAAGRGRRMGGETTKQYMPLGEKPVLVYSLEAFDAAPSVDRLVLVSSRDDKALLTDILSRFPPRKPCQLVEGGRERQESVLRALTTLAEDACLVAIHDAVRPLITVDVIEAGIAAALEFEASAVGMPVKDTIKRTDGSGFAIHTPERSTLWQIQTPQIFQYNLILRAHLKAQADGIVATDDSSLVELLGVPVKLVEGGYHNIKITTPEDLMTARQFLGIGGDRV